MFAEFALVSNLGLLKLPFFAGWNLVDIRFLGCLNSRFAGENPGMGQVVEYPLDGWAPNGVHLRSVDEIPI